MEHNQFKSYIRNDITQIRKITEIELRTKLKPNGEFNHNIFISAQDIINGHPKPGDMIARNPKYPDKLWLMTKEDYNTNYIPCDNDNTEDIEVLKEPHGVFPNDMAYMYKQC